MVHHTQNVGQNPSPTLGIILFNSCSAIWDVFIMPSPQGRKRSPHKLKQFAQFRSVATGLLDSRVQTPNFHVMSDPQLWLFWQPEDIYTCKRKPHRASHRGPGSPVPVHPSINRWRSPARAAPLQGTVGDRAICSLWSMFKRPQLSRRDSRGLVLCPAGCERCY